MKFTFQTGKLAGSEYSTMWKTGLSSITTKGNVVSFNFSGDAELPGVGLNMYSIRDRAAAHLVAVQRDRDHDRERRRHVEALVGTGPFTYGAGAGGSQTLQCNRRSGWWADEGARRAGCR